MRLLVSWNEITDEDIVRIREFTQVDVIVTNTKEEARALIQDADVVFGSLSPELLKYARKLKWLQVAYAGVERLVGVEWANPDMILTNGSGIFGPCIAENVIGMLLSFNRGLHFARDYQNKAQWNWEYPFKELQNSTVGLLGYGDIGKNVAKRLQGFDVRIIGIRQNPTGHEPYAEKMVPIREFDRVIPELDYLICSLPETAQTVGLMDANKLHKLPTSAFVINVGRGSLFIEKDLIEALEQGSIAGAGLDVTSEEPLPDSSPLWQMPNVILTPHNSGQTPKHLSRAVDLFAGNWQKFIAGEPLDNVVERALGY